MSEKHKNHKLKYEKYTAELVSFLRSIEKKDAIDLISDLLTPQEIIEIQERIQLLKKLKKGQTQREIAKDLGVSITTVNRGNRVLKFGTGIIDKYL